MFVNVKDNLVPAGLAEAPQEFTLAPVEINLNVLNGTHALYANPSDSQVYFYPTRVRLQNLSASMTTAQVSVGSNSTDFDDVVAAAAHTGLTGATLFKDLTIIAAGAVRVAPGDTLTAKVTTAEGGALTGDMVVSGYLWTE